MKRKVREDFNPEKEYSVNVEGCTEEEKKEVQQAAILHAKAMLGIA